MHLEEAEDMIGRALQFDPNNGAYLDSLGWIHYRQGKFEEALTELLRAAQNLTRHDPIVFEHIGDTYSKLNRIPQALDFWQKACALRSRKQTTRGENRENQDDHEQGPAGEKSIGSINLATRTQLGAALVHDSNDKISHSPGSAR